MIPRERALVLAGPRSDRHNPPPPYQSLTHNKLFIVLSLIEPTADLFGLKIPEGIKKASQSAQMLRAMEMFFRGPKK